ncbi:MAG TPA: NAD-dependent epimerase/dehydratase family protein [Gemmatimonadales bacterium]|nr:NAD-dependent epimerase/dehydratase family protein [Gemmatimonadales bacterium]
MKVLVTGADGFVGRHVVRRLLAGGHEVIGARRPEGELAGPLPDPSLAGARWVPLELHDEASLADAAALDPDGVVHLAAVSSTAEAAKAPVDAWTVNAIGVVRLLRAFAERRATGRGDPVVVLVSSAEVYGIGEPRPRRESDPVAPLTPYAASKAAAEVAGLEAWRRTGLRVVVARPFQHTGPGQTTRFVLPAFAERLRAARASGAGTVATGNLTPVRDFLDVRDVASAYQLLLERGIAGETYNVARGNGVPLAELFARLARIIGAKVEPVADPALARRTDIPHLVGDPARLRHTTGWTPVYTLDDMLRDIADAEAH